jgi:hypothetical protein
MIHIITKGNWSLEWTNESNEGYNGDYNDADPADKCLLRVYLTYKGMECIDGSYCTQAPDDTPEPVLQQMSEDLFSALTEPQDSDIDFDYNEDGAVHFNDRSMQEWTWRTDPQQLSK